MGTAEAAEDRGGLQQGVSHGLIPRRIWAISWFLPLTEFNGFHFVAIDRRKNHL